MPIGKIKEFEERLAALEIVTEYVDRALSLLHQMVTGEITISKKSENDLMRLALTHYVINNLFALFDTKKENNSLVNLSKHFEAQFPNNFFSEFSQAIENMKVIHRRDLERLKKNRHLSTAHLGASKREKLGWSPEVARNIDEILGTQSSVASVESLIFITPYQILEMPIAKTLPILKNILQDLQIKLIEYRPINL